MSFWDIVWFIFIFFAFMAYLMVMFSVIGDLFRDDSVSGWVKALWIIGLIFLPFLTLLIYVIVRGKGMAERTAAGVETARRAQDEYVRGGRPATRPPSRSPRPRSCSTRAPSPRGVRRAQGQGARLTSSRLASTTASPSPPQGGHGLAARVARLPDASGSARTPTLP